MRRHFRLGIIKILGPTATAVLLMFGAYELFKGPPWVAAAGVALAGLSALATWQALRRDDGRMDALLTLSWLLGGALASHALHQAVVPWLYLLMMSNFFVVARSIGLASNACLIAIMLITPGILLGAEHTFSLIAVSLLITGLGYLLSLRLEDNHVRLEEMASHDALTGLPNRRMLERSLSQHVADPLRKTRRHALVVIDIDRFKQVNDLQGHVAGDRMLTQLAALLRFEVRVPDEVFRFGGDEFVVVMRLQSRSELAAFSKRLQQIANEALRDSNNNNVTVSLGAAMLCDEQDWQDWFSRADVALYAAKNGGRDNYVIADDLAPA